MNYFVINPRTKIIKLENHGIHFRHNLLIVQDGKDKGGKAKKSK
jgi:hypothetical protein